MVDGLYLKHGRAVEPHGQLRVHLRAQLLHELHDSPYAGHLGVRKALVSGHYWWPTLTDDATKPGRTCHLYQKNQARFGMLPGLLQPVELPLVPWTLLPDA